MSSRSSSVTHVGGGETVGRGTRAPVLIFLHLPKTAGSTVVRLLEREYGSDAVLSLYDSTFGDEFSELAADRAARTRAIAGHFYFGVHEHVPGPCRYFTFLREPIERIVSHYHFVRRQPKHYLYEAATSMSIGGYVEFCGAAEPNNDQTRLLAGRETASLDGACSPEMLPVAERNLDRHCVVGLTDEFDRSLLLLAHAFGWRRPYYVKQNVSGRDRRREELDDETRGAIVARNSLDIELYRYGRELFERQVAEHREALSRELRIFVRANGLYGGLRRLRSAARRASSA
jgi:Sulfotransferase family